MANSRWAPPVTWPAIIVGQDEPGRGIALHEPAKDQRVGRVAADQAVQPKLKDIPGAGDCDSAGVGRQRPLFDGLRLVADHDLVDFVESEAGQLDRRIVQNQFLEFDFELVEVPLPLLAESVGGKAQQALLDRGQVVDAHAGRAAEAQQPRRLEPDLAVEDDIILADEDRVAETERADRRRHFPHMGGIAQADLARWRAKLVQRHIGYLQRRQEVVAQRARGRAGRRQPRKVLAPAPALTFQLLLERPLAGERIGIDS
jgi:hypothetical protein